MAKILRNGGTGELPDNEGRFEILVLDECDNCHVKEAHALKTDDGTKCLVCGKGVVIEKAAALTVTKLPYTGDAICNVYYSCVSNASFRVGFHSSRTDTKRVYRSCTGHLHAAINEAVDEA